MIVIDTNVLLYLYFPSGRSKQVEQVLQADRQWLAPSLWRSEFLNVATFLFRKKLITVNDIHAALDAADQLVMTFNSYFDPAPILDRISNSSCSAYDCEYVAMAELFETKLLTYDKQVIEQFPNTAMTPDQFLKMSK